MKESLSRDNLLIYLSNMFDELTGCEGSTLSEDMVILKDLGIDSVNLINYVLDLEKRMEISIGDGVLFDLRTIGDLIDYILDNRK